MTPEEYDFINRNWTAFAFLIALMLTSLVIAFMIGLGAFSAIFSRDDENYRHAPGQTFPAQPLDPQFQNDFLAWKAATGEQNIPLNMPYSEFMDTVRDWRKRNKEIKP
jgi:hypothetical protein